MVLTGNWPARHDLSCWLGRKTSHKETNKDPALKTKTEITKYINWQQFTKRTRGKLNEQLFPGQVLIQLPKLN